MPAITGLEVAGEIAATGPGVSGWNMGDRVLGDPINRVEGELTGETVHGGMINYTDEDFVAALLDMVQSGRLEAVIDATYSSNAQRKHCDGWNTAESSANS